MTANPSQPFTADTANTSSGTTRVSPVGPTESDRRIPSELLDVGAVAQLLGVSARHVYRLTDAGHMPKPVRLGRLVRWPRKSVLDWIAAGCPAVRGGSR